jgi:2-polyprenyl-3-methyl-5-hydroxy-6-metoxy-1,4-benzoquinol methylase
VTSYEPEFARLYDLIVHGQEEAEAEAVELEFVRRAFREAGRPVREVLDAGCGRGRFLVPLARDGYSLHGIDLSPHMLAECARRLERQGLKADLHAGAIEALEADAAFDALLCMDSVICYMLETDRLLAVLRSFHRALRPGGLLVMDNWNMLAQWAILERTTSDVIHGERLRIDYREHHSYDSLRSLFRIRMEGEVHEDGRSSPFRHQELLRVTTPEEMRAYLAAAGFGAISVHPDYRYGAAEPENPESITYVARREQG